MLEFEPFPKIARVAKNTVTITEKLDGTNAQINIIEIATLHPFRVIADDAANNLRKGYDENVLYRDKDFLIFAGSRKRYVNDLEQANDNYGFAAWVRENAEELLKLGHGRHFGEWYGRGINRGYDLEERRFALFNTKRWGDHNPNTPKCCEVVPVLYEGKFYAGVDAGRMNGLRFAGSRAAPGYMKPEGIVMYFHATNSYLKITFESPEGKWKDNQPVDSEKQLMAMGPGV